jgi:uncharacterized protein (TIGR03435 family)
MTKLTWMALLAAAGLASAQSAPAFEVASVRQNKRYEWIRRPWNTNLQCAAGPRGGVCGNRFTEETASLMDLSGDAYGVRRFHIFGLPDWGDSGHDVYDIDARIAGGRTPALEEARVMLQTLLADRFHLKLHRETKDLPIYALVVPKNGSKLTPSKDGCKILGVGGDALVKDALAVQKWAGVEQALSRFADRPIIDKTGFDATYYCTSDGQYPFEMLRDLPTGGGARGDFQPASTSPDDSTGPSIFTLVRDKWGLKLEPQKAPLDVLVIDHVERPTDN